MGEQEKEQSSTDHPINQPHTSLQEEQSGQIVAGRAIWADTITATNVVSGMQVIEHQVINIPVQKYALPLQRPRRAGYFTDREAELAKLLTDLKPDRVVSVCGPGGMGKTALIAEALWTLAPGDTPPVAFPDGILFYSFSGQPNATLALEHIARTLGEAPQSEPAPAAQRALSGRHVLLVFDSADEANSLEQVLAVCANCAVLMSSRRRSDAVDPVYRVDLQPLPTKEAVRVVQAWGGKRVADAGIAAQIAECIGNLPLALQLVGRYLSQREEEASEYLTWLQEDTLSALDQRPSERESVPMLLERSFARLSIDARQILAVIGLIAHAPFPREIIADVLQLSRGTVSRALGELVNYGLLIRLEQLYEVSHTLIHTYAHQVLLKMYDLVRLQQVSGRIVRILGELFPITAYENWTECEQLLPHARVCSELTEQYSLAFPETVRLLRRVGSYLRESGRYTEAELFWKQSLAIAEQVFGLMHLETAWALHNLALLYVEGTKYEQAEPLYQRSLMIKEQVLGLNDPDTASTVDNLALLYARQGKYEQAEALHQRALAVREQTLGSAHPDTAKTLHNLAALYADQGKYEQAEELYQRAIAIKEQVEGPAHPDTARTLQNLGILYAEQGKYGQARPLMQRALAIQEQALGPVHPDTATSLHNFASLLVDQGKQNQVTMLYARAVAIRDILGSSDPRTAEAFKKLTSVTLDQEQFEEVELLYKRALAIREQALGPTHPETTGTLERLRNLYTEQGNYEQAELLMKQALTIRERGWG